MWTCQPQDGPRAAESRAALGHQPGEAQGDAVMRYNQRQRRLMHSGRMPIPPRASARTLLRAFRTGLMEMRREPCPAFISEIDLRGTEGRRMATGRPASAPATEGTPNCATTQREPASSISQKRRATHGLSCLRTASGCRAVGEDGATMLSHRRRGLGNDHAMPTSGIPARHEAVFQNVCTSTST